MNPICIVLHDVVEQPPSVGLPLYTITRSQFREHLEAVRQNIGLEAVQRVDEVGTTKEHRVCLTFDDGAMSAHGCVLEELSRLAWPAHFFVVTDWIGRPGYLGVAEIRDLVRLGHVVGSHSRSHPEFMARLSMDDLLLEWTASCARLSDVVGTPVRIASLPNGFYSRRVAQAAGTAGIRLLFTSEPTTSTFMVGNCRVVGRYSVRRSTPSSVVGAIAAGTLRPRAEQTAMWQLKKAVKFATGDSYLAIRRSLLAMGFEL